MPRAVAAARSTFAAPRPTATLATADRTRWGMGPTGRSSGVVLTGPSGLQVAPLEYLRRPYVAALNPTAAMTVLGRATLQNDTAQAIGCAFFSQALALMDSRWGFTLGFADRTRATLFIATGPTTLINGSTPVGSFPASSGRHVWWGAWFDGAGIGDVNRANADLDGVLNLIPSWSAAVPATLRTGTAVYARGVPTLFGGYLGIGARTWSGVISDGMIFNVKLADATRAAIYAAADPYAAALALANPPVSYWRMDEETGAVCFDSIGTHHLGLVTDPIGQTTTVTKGRRFELGRYALRQEAGTRKFYSFPSAFPAGGTRIMCAWDSRTVASGENEPGQAANVYSYRVQLQAWLRTFGKNVDMVGPQSSGPTYLADKLHDGVSGRAAETYAGVVAADVLAFDPEILIGFGIINDQLALGRTPAQCVANVTAVVNAALAAKPTLRILLVDEPPSTVAAQQVNVDAYNALFDGMIAAGGWGGLVERCYAGTRIDSRANFDANHFLLQGGDQVAYIVARQVEPYCADA